MDTFNLKSSNQVALDLDFHDPADTNTLIACLTAKTDFGEATVDIYRDHNKRVNYLCVRVEGPERHKVRDYTFKISKKLSNQITRFQRGVCARG